MKVHFEQPMLQIDGNQIVMSLEDKSPLTLGRAVAAMLMGLKDLKGQPASKVYLLAKAVYEAKELEVSKGDLQFLASAAEESDMFGLAVRGQAAALLVEVLAGEPCEGEMVPKSTEKLAQSKKQVRRRVPNTRVKSLIKADKQLEDDNLDLFM